jgi:hypothetical protein
LHIFQSSRYQQPFQSRSRIKKTICSPEHRQTREVAAPVEIRQRERWSIEHSLLVCTLEEKAFFGLLRQLEVQVEVASVLSFLVAEK